MAKPTKTTPPAPSKSLTPKPSGLTREQKVEAITLITRKLITRDSGLAGLLLWIPTALGRDDLNADAYTDGNTIYYCDSFFVMPPEHQLAVVIHETLHVVLRHNTRFKQIRTQYGNEFSTQIADICADAIVIRAIEQCPKIGPLSVVNPYIITAEDLVNPEDIKKIPAQQWTFEMLYNYVNQKVEAAIDKLKSKYGQERNEDLQSGEGDPSNQNSDSHSQQVETRIWQERVKRAAAGSEPGSILREVLKDLPDTKTPWEKHFREFMVAHVMPTTTLDWSRPSRRLLASKGRLGYYEPGIQRELGVKTAGIVIDTSGSIDEKLLSTFIAETNAIMEQTGCSIVLICADADVQSVEKFSEPIKRTYKAKGGGGTDFRPAIKELEKHDIDCCVYLTDLCGAFPERKPSYPILWATLVDIEVPFGKKVLIDYLSV